MPAAPASANVGPQGAPRLRSSFCTIGFQRNKWGAQRTVEVPIDDILPVLAEAGYDAAEIWWPHIEALDDAGLDRLAARLASHRLGVAMISPYFNFTTSDETAAESMALAQLVLHAARRLRAGGVRCFTGKTASADATPEQWSRAVRCLRELGDASRADGIAWCLETHSWNLMDTIDGSRRLIEDVARDNVRLILQPSTFHEQWLAAVDALLPYARHVHATNSRPGADGKAVGCALADGAMDWRLIIARLRAAGFVGHVSIEWFGEDPAGMARREAPWLRAAFAG